MSNSFPVIGFTPVLRPLSPAHRYRTDLGGSDWPVAREGMTRASAANARIPTLTNFVRFNTTQSIKPALLSRVSLPTSRVRGVRPRGRAQRDERSLRTDFSRLLSRGPKGYQRFKI